MLKQSWTDGDNRLLWRKSPQRLEAEAIRDAILSVSGELNPEMGGPGYRDVEAEKSGDNTTYTFTGGFNGALNRRTIYRTWIRRVNHPLLDTLDCADPSISIPRRTVTTTPIQALALLNNTFMARAAGAFAERVVREAGDDLRQQIRLAYRLAYLRDPVARKWHRRIASRSSMASANSVSSFSTVMSSFILIDI